MNPRSRLWLFVFALVSSGLLHAQPFDVLHTFTVTSGSPITNLDGAQPYNTGLLLADGNLYGTTYYGGTNSRGVVFRVSTNGMDFTVLHTFSASSSAFDYTNSDGEYPQGGLAIQGDTLYGTTLNGGMTPGGYGTIFSMKTNGSAFTLIRSFDSAGGYNPLGPLVITNGTIYGVGNNGGTNGYGTVFSLSLDGSGYTVLHTFQDQDGHYPNGVVLQGDILYGSTFLGGTNGNGTIFSVKTNGDLFTVLHTFHAGSSGAYNQFNDDGMNPEMPPAVAGDTVYGTTVFGGPNNKGTLFSLNTNGTGFTVLHAFSSTSGTGERYNEDGAYPMGISVADGVLYGVAEDGGPGGNGVMYSINADGTDFSVLHGFSDNLNAAHTNYDGAYPEGALVVSDTMLFGTAEQGAAGNGSVFRVRVVPTIKSLEISGADLVIHGFNGFSNETCTVLMGTNLAEPLTSWLPMSTNTLSSGAFTLTATNAVDSTAVQRFYTLRLP